MMKNILVIIAAVCALGMLSGCGDKCSCCKCDKPAECPCASCTCEQKAPEAQPAAKPEEAAQQQAPETQKPAENEPK